MMKQKQLTILTVLIALLLQGLCLSLYAQSLRSWEEPETGMTYWFWEGSGEAEVRNYSPVSGDLTILSSITVNGRYYRVTGIGLDGFEGCSGLTSLTIPSTIKSVRSGAFDGCTSLVNVKFIGIPHFSISVLGGTPWYENLPEGVVYINNVACTYKGDMPEGTSIVINDGTEAIAGGAFMNCKNLVSVSIPNSVKEIGNQAFCECWNLASVNIPNSVESIGDKTFYRCINLQSLTIPSSVTSISKTAFGQNKNLTSIVVEPGNTVYDSRENCNAIVETATNEVFFTCMNSTVPSTVTRIGDNTYEYAKLTSLTIPNKVTSIGACAFYGCENLSYLTVPSSVTSIGERAFNCCYLKRIVVDKGNPVYDSRDNCNAIIETATNKLVLGSINTIIIPSTVTSIGDYAFTDAGEMSPKGITAVSIPSSIKSIGAYAFCSYTLETIRSLNKEPFPTDGFSTYVSPSGYIDGVTLFVPAGTKAKYMQTDGWKEFKNIVEIGSNSLKVGDEFYTINYSFSCKVTNIKPKEVWLLANDVSNAIIPSVIMGPDGNDYTVTSVDAGSFYFSESSSNKESVVIPKSVISFRKSEYTNYINGFANCVSIEVESGNPVFDSRDGCNAIIETATNTLLFGCPNTTIPNTITSIGENAFSECSSLTSITIPNSVTSIGSGAFQNCGLTSLNIPNSVTSIGYQAFYGCSSLTSVTIPNSVVAIGDNAFGNCSNLREIRSLIESPFYVRSLIESPYYGIFGVFTGIPEDAVLYVPAYTKEAYENCEGWKNFKTIVEADSPWERPLKEGESFNAGQFSYKVTKINNKEEGYVGVSKKKDSEGELSGSIVVPESVQGPDGRMYTVTEVFFSGCSGLTSVTLPNTLQTIGKNAFYQCYSLTSITIPNSVTTIGESAFGACTGLTSITIPNGVTSIQRNAFTGCKGLTSVTISASVTDIGIEAFSNCKSLANVVVESGNPVFDSRDNCNAIIKTKENKFYMGFAFSTIPNTVTSIGDRAFSSSPLSTIVIPASVTVIEGTPFDRCENLSSIVVADGNPVYDSREGCNAIIETATNKLVIGCKTTVIPNTVTIIGNRAFYGILADFHSITIPNSVKSIEDQAFSYCGNLTEVHSLIEQPFAINSNVFNGVNHATLYVPAGTLELYRSLEGWNQFVKIFDPKEEAKLKVNETFLADEVFYQVTSVGDNPVVHIGTGSYEGIHTSTATAVTIPTTIVGPDGIEYTVTSIYSFAFKGYTNLTSITIPKTVTEMGNDLFGCPNLSSIVVENGNPVYDSREGCNAIIETATNTMVYGCNTTKIPSTVTTIGASAFAGCTGLTSMTIPETVTSIGEWAFYGCTGLTSITLPSTLKSIAEATFKGCTGLTSITIPETVTSIGLWAFEECAGLTSITIPSSITFIEIDAFRYCTGLKDVYVLAEVPPLNKNVIHWEATLHVPVGTKAAYKAADGWNYYSRIVEIGKENDLEVNDVFTAGALTYQVTSTDNPLCVWIGGNSSSMGWESIKGLDETKLNEFGILDIPAKVLAPDGNEYTVTSLAMNVFRDCQRLTCVSIPATVTSIGYAAFQVCRNLAKVRTYIEEPFALPWDVFDGISENATLYVPIGAKAKYEATEGWDKFERIVEIGPEVQCLTEEGDVFTVGGTTYQVTATNPKTVQVGHNFETAIDRSTEGAFTIPASIKGPFDADYTVTSLNYHAFEYCVGLTSITIPHTVTSIGSSAFWGCTGLTSVTIPNSVTSIVGRTFAYCNSLTSITVEMGNPVYDSRNDCNAIIETATNKLIFGCQSTVIPSTVTSIGEYAFYQCPNMYIPKSVVDIHLRAFEEFGGASSITVEEGNPVYDSRDNCNAIINTASNELMLGSQKTVIPNGITSISYFAFLNCSGLTSITIPSSVKSIRGIAFNYCTNLTTVISLVKEPFGIDKNTFRGIPEDATLYVPVGTKAKYEATWAWRQEFKNIVEVDMSKLYEVKNDQTIVVKNLEPDKNGKLVIPEKAEIDGKEYPVTEIAPEAFKDNKDLVEVTIPETVTIIGASAFAGCTNLKAIYVLSLEPIDLTLAAARGGIRRADGTTVSQFDGVDYEACVLYVPYGCGEAYRNAEGWKLFKHIVEMEDTAINGAMLNDKGKATGRRDSGNEMTNVKWYDLNGRRISQPKKGVNILRDSKGRNRKVVIK